MTTEDTVPVDRSSDAAPPETPRFSYQPALDGLRAIAVMLVLIGHGSENVYPYLFPGGWLGVDVFFALSGYLITSLLLTEWARFDHVRLRDFYARRFLRLAPLSLAVVAVVWTIVQVAPNTSKLVLSNRGALSIIFYVSNFYYQRDIVALGSLIHFWSLSIEEQFYFIWPSILVLVLRYGKRHWRQVGVALTATIVLAQWIVRRQLWITDIESGRSSFLSLLSFYAGSFRRPDAIILGCLLAIATFGWKPGKQAIRILGVWAVAGLVIAALIVNAAKLEPSAFTPHFFITNWGLSLFNVSVLGVLACLIFVPRSIGARLLSTPPMVWIGRRAYGIYLLNPLIVPYLKFNTAMSWPVKTVCFLVFSFGGAALSYRFFELPFLRRKARFSPLAEPAGGAPTNGHVVS